MTAPIDPFATLGVAASASEAELRAAYRRLAQRHHPDHNGGSPESAVRFAEIQEAYAHARLRLRTAARPAAEDPGHAAALEARIAEMEAELRRARAEREKATRRAARIPRTRPGAPPAPRRPTPEELGYVSTDDSFGKILDDLADGISASASDARDAARRAASPAPHPRPRSSRSLADWIDELGARLTGETGGAGEGHDGEDG